MSNELREELAALWWPDLKRVATKEHGLKPHPEWTAPDYINAIIGKISGSTKSVTDKEALDSKDAKWGPADRLDHPLDPAHPEAAGPSSPS